MLKKLYQSFHSFYFSYEDSDLVWNNMKSFQYLDFYVIPDKQYK